MVKKTNKNVLGAIGVGAAIAAAAGAYFLYGSKNAKQNRMKVKSWALKAKAEVMEKLEKAQNINEKTFSKIVDDVVKKYKALRNVDAKEIALLAMEMKSHWNAIKKDLERHVQNASPGAPKKKTPVKKRAK